MREIAFLESGAAGSCGSRIASGSYNKVQFNVRLTLQSQRIINHPQSRLNEFNKPKNHLVLDILFLCLSELPQKEMPVWVPTWFSAGCHCLPEKQTIPEMVSVEEQALVGGGADVIAALTNKRAFCIKRSRYKRPFVHLPNQAASWKEPRRQCPVSSETRVSLCCSSDSLGASLLQPFNNNSSINSIVPSDTRRATPNQHGTASWPAPRALHYHLFCLG